MIILGVSPLDKDATASLMINGKVVFASGEERYSRVKQQSGFPKKAIEAALEHAGITMDDVHVVAYPFLAAKSEMACIEKNKAELKEQAPLPPTPLPCVNLKKVGDVPGLDDINEKMQKPLHHKIAYSLLGKPSIVSKKFSEHLFDKWAEKAQQSFLDSDKEFRDGLDSLGFTGKVRRVDHHRSHAANAFYCSKFDEALVVTLDGYGTGQAASVSLATKDGIKLLHKSSYPHSMGLMYEQATAALGFKPSRHEGKIVGLAAYGDPMRLGPYIVSRIKQTPGEFAFDMPHNPYFASYLASKYPKVDVAAGFQYALEKVVTDYVAHYVKDTGVSNIVLSGGVVANVKLNQRIYEIDDVDSIFVYPNMGDGGCATGAAILVSSAAGEKIDFEDPYLGREYSDEEIEKALKESGLEYEKMAYMPSAIALLVRQGYVVARFNGRMEYGPRALGNRSILYHGGDVEVNNWLNKRLGRTEFMPFAPVTLADDADTYFYNSEGVMHTGEFMTVTLDCTEKMKFDCPAAVHIDGTARPQLITKERNESYYDILSVYRELTGKSSIINTSFNMHEEPIVESPVDAIRAFVDGKLDALAIGSFLVKSDNVKDEDLT